MWFCHACARGGGVKDFALVVGEPWAIASLPRQERKRVAVALRRREAEAKARAILENRREERLDAIFDQWREVNRDATHAVELLALFHVWLEAAADGEVEQ